MDGDRQELLRARAEFRRSIKALDADVRERFVQYLKSSAGEQDSKLLEALMYDVARAEQELLGQLP